MQKTTRILWLVVLIASAMHFKDSRGQSLVAFLDAQRHMAVQPDSQSLISVLAKLEAKFKVSFNYDNDLLERIIINFDDRKIRTTPLSQILKEILEPADLRYERPNAKHVVIMKIQQSQKGPEKEEKMLAIGEVPENVSLQPQLQVQAQPQVVEKEVKGRVTTAENGETLPGVSILIKGTRQGTISDVDGRFVLTVPDEKTVLIFSFVGYLTQEIEVGNQSPVDVRLKVDEKALEEVVVVGYGTRKKANLTGAVDQISAEALQNRPITNVSRGLQGLIPNLNITNRGGNPNAGAGINLRGTTSINGGGPLILVDNVQMDIDLLNPDDIESITVLKDAASAAIYGARGAFGVILITLKQGARDRKPVISYTGGMEFNSPTYLPDMLSSWEYMQATNIARQRRYGTVIYSPQQLDWAKAHFDDPVNNPSYHMQPNGSIFWHANVDNFGEMLQNWAPAQNHSMSLNGGSGNLSYFASMGSRRQEGMFRDATDVLKRHNLLINLNVQVTDKLKVGFKSSYTNKNYEEPHRYTGKGSSWWEQMTRGAPQILFPIKTPADAPLPNAPTVHFYNFLNSGSRNVTNTEMGLYSVNAELDLIKGLKLKGDFNYRTTNQERKDEQKEFGSVRDRWEYQYNQTTPSYVYRESIKTDYFAANAYLTFDKEVKDGHYISVLAGFNQEWSRNVNFDVQGNNLISNEVPVLRLITGEIFTGDGETDWAIRGLFSRLSYSYKEKYLFEMNGRYDGTSRFPRERRFNFFPSFSAGWRLTEEGFMNWIRPVFSELKFRMSYGDLGNQNLSSAYPFVTSFGVTNPVQYLLDSGLPLGLTPPGLISPDLTWERASTIDFGLDMSLWGKLHLNYDWYKRTTSDMLVAGEKLPAVLGVNPPNRNAAELETKGWELSLKFADRTSRGLSYDAGIVLSDYQSEITRFGNNPNKLWSTYYEGQKLGEIWGYETVGIFQTADEVTNAANHSQLAGVARQPGDIQYKDLNDDGVINWGNNTVGNPGDQRIIGNSTPRYQFGITGNLSWKGFDMRLFFQGVGKREVFPTGNFFWGQINGSADAVGTKEIYYNSWSEERRDAYYPIYKQASAFNILPQTRYIENASYIRLKNLTVGYSVPQAVTRKVGIQRIRVYFSGENLWEATPLRGNFDPEVVLSEEGQSGSFGQFYPLQRTLSFGLQLNL